MAIPMAVMRGSHAGAWRAQFVRYVRATGAEYVWSFEAQQTSADDAARAGSLQVTIVNVAAAKPQPRLAPYALGSLASPATGGSTSRIGADVSIPVATTASFFATWHPDYSNVELDQQPIAPTV